MKGQKPRWVKTKDGGSHNASIGSNCRCWMCKVVMKWVNLHHHTTGRERQQYAEKLISYLCYRMGYSGCRTTTLEQTLPKRDFD